VRTVVEQRLDNRTFTEGTLVVNKTQLIDTLAARYEGNRKQAAQALEAVIDTITREVAKGEKVAITGFGSFEKRVRDARWVRNPRTGERIKAKKTAIPKFSAGADLKAVVSGAKKLPKQTLVAAAKKTTATKTTTAKKASATKSTAKKAPATKSTATRAPAKKATATSTTSRTTASKAPAKRSTAKSTTSKTTASKAPAKRTTAKSTTSRSTAAKAPAKKTASKTTAKKATATKSTAKKSAAKKS
jgi:DNA-binding protein HU-beta